LGLATLALLAALAGCRGSGGSATPTTSSPTPAAAPGAETARFCSLSRVFYDRVTTLANDLSADPTRVRRFVDAVVAVAKDAAAAAPAAISSDARLLTDAATDYAHGLEAAGYDTARLAPDAAASLTRPDVAAASQRVQDYEAANCGGRR